MLTKIKSALKWRYDVHISEYVDLFGSPMFYLKTKIRNIWLLRNPKIIYIYANKRNVGDYISFKGIRQLIGLPGPECFCSPLWADNLAKILRKAKQRNPDCLLVIGGGGLLQPVFEDFWNEILASELAFVTFGIGINKMHGRSEISEPLLKQIVHSAKLMGVRDIYTKERLLTLENRPIYLGVCPSVNFVFNKFWTGQPNPKGAILHIIHPSDIRLSGANLEQIKENIKLIAKELHMDYLESDNMTNNFLGALQQVSQARLVISSRLHGCIMSYSAGIPFIPLYCDEKTKAFTETHTRLNGFIPKQFENQQDTRQIILEALAIKDNQADMLNSRLVENIGFADEIIKLCPTH